jgi:hypothetical protein
VSEDVSGMCRRQNSIGEGMGVLYIMEIKESSDVIDR